MSGRWEKGLGVEGTYLLQHRLEILEHGLIGKAQKPHTVALDRKLAFAVSLRDTGIVVDSAIHLNRKPQRRAPKVQDHRAHGVLTPELEPTAATVAKRFPEHFLSRGGFFSERVRTLGKLRRAPTNS